MSGRSHCSARRFASRPSAATSAAASGVFAADAAARGAGAYAASELAPMVLLEYDSLGHLPETETRMLSPSATLAIVTVTQRRPLRQQHW